MSVAIGAQIVGSLLVFILLTLPSSTARYIGKTIPAMIGWSVFFALVGVWAGLYLGFITNWPETFFIATIEVVIYLVARSEEHTSELQSRFDLVCSLLLEKK